MEELEAAQVVMSGMSARYHADDPLACRRRDLLRPCRLWRHLCRAQESVAGLRCKCAFSRPVQLRRVACCNQIRCQFFSNPLLAVSDLPAAVADAKRTRVIVDNAFAPMIVSPRRHGAGVVGHSLTQFVDGTIDFVAVCVVSSREFIVRLNDINAAPSMLRGILPGNRRAASILKRICTARTFARVSMARVVCVWQTGFTSCTAPGFPSRRALSEISLEVKRRSCAKNGSVLKSDSTGRSPKRWQVSVAAPRRGACQGRWPCELLTHQLFVA